MIKKVKTHLVNEISEIRIDIIIKIDIMINNNKFSFMIRS